MENNHWKTSYLSISFLQNVYLTPKSLIKYFNLNRCKMLRKLVLVFVFVRYDKAVLETFDAFAASKLNPTNVTGAYDIRIKACRINSLKCGKISISFILPFQLLRNESDVIRYCNVMIPSRARCLMMKHDFELRNFFSSFILVDVT